MGRKKEKRKSKATVVHVSGNPPLIERLTELVNSTIPGRHSTVSSEVTNAANEGLDAIHAILKMPSSRNEKLTAEACQLYADTQKKVAEARKLHAEAHRVEMENSELELRQKLIGLRLLAIIENNEDVVRIVDQTMGEVERDTEDDSGKSCP